MSTKTETKRTPAAKPAQAAPIAEVIIRIRPGSVVMAHDPMHDAGEEYGCSGTAEVCHLSRDGATVRRRKPDDTLEEVFRNWASISIDLEDCAVEVPHAAAGAESDEAPDLDSLAVDVSHAASTLRTLSVAADSDVEAADLAAAIEMVADQLFEIAIALQIEKIERLKLEAESATRRAD